MSPRLDPDFVRSDSRVAEFGAAVAIAELELALAGHDALDETCEPLRSELDLIERACSHFARREIRELLEVGCGLGTLLLPLLRRGRWVTGLDIEPRAVAGCRARLSEEGHSTRLMHANVRNLRSEAEFDAALIMCGLLASLADEDQQLDALRRLRRAIRPGGLLILDHRNLLAMWPVFGRELVRRDRLPDGRLVELGRMATIASFEGVVNERRWAKVARELGPDPLLEISGTTFEHHDCLRVTTISETCSMMRLAGFEVVLVEPHIVRGGPWIGIGEPFGRGMDDPAFVWIVGRRPN